MKTNRTCIPKDVSMKLLDGTTINGKVNVCGHDRVSDLLMEPMTDFLPVFNATYMGQSGIVVIVNKRGISLVIPREGA